MTALDQALIKAYQRQRAGGPHATFAGAPPVAPALVACANESTWEQAGTRPEIPARPALEIERFDWPPLVHSLREAASDEWPPLVELLLGGEGTLLVTGCRRGEGRTSVALFVALMLSADGRRVGLVDADFVKPQLAARLGILAATGWTEALAHGLPAAEAMVESLTDHVILLPLRETAERTDRIDTAVVRAAIGALRAHCDWICIDAGPPVDADDAYDAVLGAGVDAALVVRDARQSRLQQSHAVGRRLAQAGVDRWAIIENFARAAHV